MQFNRSFWKKKSMPTKKKGSEKQRDRDRERISIFKYSWQIMPRNNCHIRERCTLKYEKKVLEINQIYEY